VKYRVVAAVLLGTLAVGVAVLAHAGSGGPAPYRPPIDPAAFTAGIDNPYLPLRPGTRWAYEGRTDEGLERKVVEVTDRTRVLMGVTCVEVHDTVTVDGRLAEDTLDWFAEDGAGTVWYFGETTRKIDDSGRSTPAGSWEAGVKGALPGIAMPADPKPGSRAYRQEYLRGEAEDMARVVGIGGELTVPFGSYVQVLVTREWSPLEPGVAEHKLYAPGIGLIREEGVEGESGHVDLIELTKP
jgi:hypothetical protein